MQKNRYFCNVSQQVLSKVVGLRLLGFCFISWISMIHMDTIYGFSKTNTWILRSFDFNSILTRQTSEKVAFKSGFHNLFEYFLPSTFTRIVSVLPEKNQKFLWLGGLQPPSPPPPPARTPMLATAKFGKKAFYKNNAPWCTCLFCIGWLRNVQRLI